MRGFAKAAVGLAVIATVLVGCTPEPTKQTDSQIANIRDTNMKKRLGPAVGASTAGTAGNPGTSAKGAE